MTAAVTLPDAREAAGQDRHPASAPERDGQHSRVAVLMPVFNDWAACARVLSDLDAVFAEHGLQTHVVVVDDGSTETPGEGFAQEEYRVIRQVDVLRLRRNVGHQRAICIGLSHLEAELDPETVVVMDADGEDAPADVPALLARYEAEGRAKIVFAERAKRSERRLFRLFYVLYLIVHRLLTGFGVKVGNFSVVPRARLKSLVVVPELWIHYAASVFASRQPYSTVPTARAKRVDGNSSMNFTGLVCHGLTAISVYSHIVGVRLVVAASALALASALAMLGIVGIHFFTPLAVPQWTAYVAGILFLVLLQSILSAIIFSFLILANRNAAVLLPTRDYAYFVAERTTRFCNAR